MGSAAVYSQAGRAPTETERVAILLSGGGQCGRFPAPATREPPAGDGHQPFHRMLIWRAISLQVGVVARAPTSSHCCISISHQANHTIGLIKAPSPPQNWLRTVKLFTASSLSLPSVSFLSPSSLLPSFISSYLSFPLIVAFPLPCSALSECSSALAAC